MEIEREVSDAFGDAPTPPDRYKAHEIRTRTKELIDKLILESEAEKIARLIPTLNEFSAKVYSNRSSVWALLLSPRLTRATELLVQHPEFVSAADQLIAEMKQLRDAVHEHLRSIPGAYWYIAKDEFERTLTVLSESWNNIRREEWAGENS